MLLKSVSKRAYWHFYYNLFFGMFDTLRFCIDIGEILVYMDLKYDMLVLYTF
jgi:hypothetical protein